VRRDGIMDATMASVLDGFPSAIARYFAAEQAKDATGVTSCFAPSASVRDESAAYSGINAIRKWWEGAQRKYRYVVEVLDASEDQGAIVVKTRLTGDFPGNVVELDYRFTVGGDNNITELVID
jgi:ketosteroid isomerase-like protein